MTSIMQTPTYPKYARYKDSGVAWLGEIPEGWSLESIRAVTKLKSEKNQPDLEVLSVYREFGVIQKKSRDDNHNVTSLDTSNYKVVKPGDLVVNKMKAWQGSMGVSDYLGLVSPAYITCEVDQNRAQPKFLHYALRSKLYISTYNSLSYGVRIGQWDMHYEDFKRIPLSIPTLKEQNRIVNFLDQKTAAIDTAIAKKQRLIELLKEQKAILINRAVTRGLNPDVAMKDSGVEWIGEIPAHWEIRRSKFLFNEIDERSETGQEELLSVSHLTGVTPRSEKNISMFMAESYSGSKLCQPGDLIINIMWAWMGALGVSRHTGIISPSYGVYRQKKLDTFNPWFLEHLLQSNQYVAEYNRRSTGLHSSRLRLYSHMFFDMELGFPSLKEQNQIEQITNEKLRKLHQIIQSTEKQIKKIQEYKQTLIAHAVTGKIKVS